MFSIVICTYNRAESLRHTLRSLVEADQSASMSWELIVVDNNSSDHTREVVQSFRDLLPIRYVFESEQGLSVARNRALLECAGSVIVFTDDDVQVDKSWLTSYERAMSHFPHAGYFGGRVVPFWPTSRPTWLHDEALPLVDGLLVRFDLGEGIRRFEANEPTPFGASFGLRREVWLAVGTFRTDLGVSGNVPGRGEESDYLARVVGAGWGGVYVGDAIAHHFTDSSRLTLRYIYFYGVQKGIAARRQGAARGSIWLALQFAVRGLWQQVRGRGDRFRQCVIHVGIQFGLREG